MSAGAIGARPGAAGIAAALLGLAGATLQFAGGLKAVGPLAGLPVDLTLLALMATLAAGVLVLAGREVWLSPLLGPPMLAAALLWLWWVLAALWSPWPALATPRLRDMLLMGPPMLAAGLLVGADRTARRAFMAAGIAIGGVVGLAVAHGLWTGSIVLGGAVGRDPTRLRVAYQIAGLTIACAGSLAALRCAMAKGAARWGWGLAALALGALALLPGGRAAFLALLLGAVLSPMLYFLLARRPRAALGWLGLTLGLGGAAVVVLVVLAPALAEQLATLERLLRPREGVSGARALLWAEGWRLGGWAGLGPGGFPPAVGVGLDRGLHPHNHALEALLEGGAVGLLLWGLVFLGATVLAAARAFAVAPARAAQIFAVCLPVALSAMVSTDLGNRMVWFALGLALSLGADARPRHV